MFSSTPFLVVDSQYSQFLCTMHSFLDGPEYKSIEHCVRTLYIRIILPLQRRRCPSAAQTNQRRHKGQRAAQTQHVYVMFCDVQCRAPCIWSSVCINGSSSHLPFDCIYLQYVVFVSTPPRSITITKNSDTQNSSSSSSYIGQHQQQQQTN